MSDQAQPTGSSPLTRGKPRPRAATACRSGLIPAHAGKTKPSHRLTGPPTAHPRSRGENYTRTRTSYIGRGSSPLTRGKPDYPHGITRVPGLIPAHAGKTLEELVNTWQARAHPRSRGENHIRRNYTPRWCRLIPAHAGKTRRLVCLAVRARAHPRSRGENGAGAVTGAGAGGSSPLTRGKRSVTISATASVGLIPAHAGKTRSSDAQMR